MWWAILFSIWHVCTCVPMHQKCILCGYAALFIGVMLSPCLHILEGSPSHLGEAGVPFPCSQFGFRNIVHGVLWTKMSHVRALQNGQTDSTLLANREKKNQRCVAIVALVIKKKKLAIQNINLRFIPIRTLYEYRCLKSIHNSAYVHERHENV